LVAEPLVLTLLGAKWAATVPLIQVLAICGLATSIQSNLDFVFFAKGRARFITILTATVCLLELPLVIFGALHGSALGAALGLLVSALIPLPFVLAALSRLIGLCWRDWFSITWRPVLATATMVSVMLAWLSYILPVTSGANSPLVALASSVVMGAATYAVAIFGLWVLAGRPPGPETFVIERALTFLTRREDRYAQK
jgi:O-antigen/teichoic acid export membrane protein